MSVAHDVFAETNPAFCAYALATFTASYVTVNPSGPEIPISYLALPIGLSSDLAETFVGTNKRTSLLAWLERNPEVRIECAERVNASLDVVTEAIRFACFTRLLSVEGARFRLGLPRSKSRMTNSLSADSRRSLLRLDRFGHWCGAAGSAKAVFQMLGVTV